MDACALFNVKDDKVLKNVTTAGFDVREAVSDTQYLFKTVQAKDWHHIDFIDFLRRRGQFTLLAQYESFRDPKSGIAFKKFIKVLFYEVARPLLGLPEDAELNDRYARTGLPLSHMRTCDSPTCKAFRCRWCEQKNVTVEKPDTARHLRLDMFKNYARCNRRGRTEAPSHSPNSQCPP